VKCYGCIFVRSEESQQAFFIDSTSEVQENVATAETSCEVSDIRQHHFSVDQHNLDAASESYKSHSVHQIITDRKPPLVKKGKPHQRNVKSLFRETAEHPANVSRSLIFSDNTPEVPRSAEVVHRKLRLPWMRKKKSYMPGEETNRWRSNFESWRSSSQRNLETNIESLKATSRGLRRTSSHSDLHNIDTVSVGWTDSDTDTMSDDFMEGSVNDRGIIIIQ